MARRVARVVMALAAGRLVYVLAGFYVTHSAGRHHLETAWFIFAGACVAALVARRYSEPWTRVSPEHQPLHVLSLPIFIALAASLYFPQVGAGLLSDDYVLLDLSLASIDEWEFFRPVPLIIWAVVYPAFGAPGLHSLSILLHAVNGWLLFNLIRSLSQSSPMLVPSMATVAFLGFPAAVEAVAWNSAVFDLSLAACALTYLNAVVRRGVYWERVALCAAALGLLCKETAVAIPVMGFALAIRYRFDLRASVWSMGVAAIYAIVRLLDAAAPRLDGASGYVAKEMISRPFAVLGVPWFTAEVASSPLLLGLFPQLIIAGLVGFYVLDDRARLRPLLIPVMWIVIGVAPLIGYLFIDDHLAGSRYVYLPLVAWCLFLATLIESQRASRITRTVVASMTFAGIYGTWQHQHPWFSAAATRDAVLTSASAVIDSTECQNLSFDGLPDHVDGAYVFRNGFAQAISRHFDTSVVYPPTPVETGCRYVWSAAGFRLDQTPVD